MVENIFKLVFHTYKLKSALVLFTHSFALTFIHPSFNFHLSKMNEKIELKCEESNVAMAELYFPVLFCYSHPPPLGPEL